MGQKTSSAPYAAGEAFGQKAQGKDQPENRQNQQVERTVTGCFFHPKGFGVQAFEPGQQEAREDHEQNKIHQKSKNGIVGKCLLSRMKIAEKNGEIGGIEDAGVIYQRLYFTDNDQQKPA